MGCCKCKEHRWEDPQEPITPVINGKRYCLFHAPKEHKGMSVEEFNEKVFARIRFVNPKSLLKCNLSGTVFPGKISFRQFDKYNPLPCISFESCKFTERAHFIRASFSDMTSFNSANFSGHTVFASASFSGDVDFSHATFNNEATFNSAIFSGHASFYLATFSRYASFRYAIFNGHAEFTWVKFNSTTIFWNVTFNRAKFSNSMAKGNVFLRELQAVNYELRFEDLDLYRFDFLRTDMTNVHFARCCWPVEEDWRSEFRRRIWPKEQRCRIAAEDELGKLEEVKDFYQGMKRKYKQESSEAEVSRWHLAEKEVELLLKAREKSVRITRGIRGILRLLIDWVMSLSFSRGMLKLYRFSSRFGEDAARAGVVLGIWILLAWLTLGIGGIQKGDVLIRGIAWPRNWTVASFENFGTMFKTLFMNVMLFKPESIPFKSANGLAEGFMYFFTRLLIPIQAALFAFALRNRFRR